MWYRKTDKARDAVAAGPSAGLMLQDRRILILADGTRSLEQLVSMLGGDIVPRVERLARDGYLASVNAPGQRVPAPAPGTTTTHGAVAPATPSAPAAASARTGARRSLPAAKMYMLDMLQLQRTPEAAELRAAIQCAADPDILVDALLAALHLIATAGKQSYGERVAERLAEILPVDALPKLEARGIARRKPPALSIVA